MRGFALAVVALAATLCGIAHVSADDWTATKMRGTVLQLIDGQWQELSRGDVVPDARAIRTLRGARVTFVRGAETIEVGPDSAVQIYDEPRRRPFTTVKQYFGEVAIEAEVKDVQHFAVQTPYLVAVVKGTRFAVSTRDDDSTVEVERGAVYVAAHDHGPHTVVTAGQSASVTPDAVIEVAGSGDLPAIVDERGRLVDVRAPGKGHDKSGESIPGDSDSPGKAKGHDKSDDSGSGNSDSSGKSKGHDKSDDSGSGNSDSSGKSKGHDKSGDSGTDAGDSATESGTTDSGGNGKGNGNANGHGKKDKD